MQARDGVFLEDLCPKLRVRRWRQSLHLITDRCCLYCGDRSESIDHVHPLSRGGESITENCVPACLSCNGSKGDSDAFSWYRSQSFYDPRRAMALRAWTEGDMRLATRLLQWTRPELTATAAGATAASPVPASPVTTLRASTPEASQPRATQPQTAKPRGSTPQTAAPGSPGPTRPTHQTRQAATPLWRWQIAS